MDKPTFIEALETHCPFTIIMENGEEYYVPNKDFAAVAPGDGSQVIVFRAEGIGFNVQEIDTIDSIRPGLEESRKSQDPFLLNSP